MSESLKHKMIKGIGWSFADNIASSGITFLVGLILARLLTPKEYGIMAMITVFIAISNSIIDSGFSNALIRKIDVKRIDYNTVFYFNLLIGIFLYGFLFVFASAIASIFIEPQLISITRVIGLVLIINSFAIVQRTILVKDVDFRTQTKVSLIASLLSSVTGIGMALYGCGVWSLVGQLLTRQLFNTIFLWIYNCWRPIWEFSVESFRELFSFGSKLLFSGLLDTIYKNIFYIIIGRFYTSAQLGQYTRAEQFNIIFSSNLTSVVQRVSYPVLSSIQNDLHRLKEAYRRVIKTTMMISFAFMLGLAAVAKPLIIILIGDKWVGAIFYLQIICFSGMLYPLHAINLNMLQVKGRSDLFFKLEIIKKIAGIFPIVLGIFYGIEYMLWGSVCVSIIAFFLNSYYSADLVNYSTIDQIKDILPTLLISLLVALPMWLISLLNISVYVMLPIQCFLGGGLAFFIYEKLKLEEYIEIKYLLLSIIKRK